MLIEFEDYDFEFKTGIGDIGVDKYDKKLVKVGKMVKYQLIL